MTYTYFAREARTGLIKIGLSGNPERRMKQLEYVEKCPVALLAVCIGRCELDMHMLFAAFRVRGEWFKLTPEHVGIAVSYIIQKESGPISPRFLLDKYLEITNACLLGLPEPHEAQERSA